MFQPTEQKFSREVARLRVLGRSSVFLHPVRQAQLKERILHRLGETPGADIRFVVLERRMTLMRYVVSVLVSLGLVGGTAFASQGALPGEVLYPVKRATEKVELAAAFTATAQARVNARQARERLEELSEIRAKLRAGGATSATTTATSTATATPPREDEDDDSVKTEVELKAEAEARARLRRAVEVLSQLQLELKAKGQATAAAALLDQVLKLELKADELHLKFESDDDGGESRGEDRRDNPSQRGTATTSTGTSSGTIREREDGEDRRGEDRDDDRDEDQKDEDRDDGNRGTPPAPVPSTSPAVTVKTYALAEVQAANSAAKCWAIVSGKVYDLTSWISKHPGGEAAIKGLCGTDATLAFQARHSGQSRPESTLATFQIGVLLK